MQTISKLINTITLILLLSACDNNIKEQNIVENIPKSVNILEDENVDASTPLLKNVRAFVLESNPSVLMAACNKIEVFNDELYILDKKFSNLFVFNNEGDFVRKIGGLGNGPGQYQSIYGFSLDRIKEEVLIYSLDDQAIFKYSLAGKFIGKANIDFYGFDFSLMNNGEYIFNTRYNNIEDYSLQNVIVTNDNGKVVSTLFPYPRVATSMVMNLSGFLCHDGRYGYFNHAYSDTIYSVDLESKTVTPRFLFSLGKKQWPYGFDFQKVMTKSSEALNSNYLGSLAFTSDSLLFFGFMEAQTNGLMPKSGVYDMKTDKVFNTNNRPDEFLLKYMNGIPKGITESGEFISSITAGQIDLIKNNFPDAWEQAKEWYPSFTNVLEDYNEEENNPVIITYTLNR